MILVQRVVVCMICDTSMTCVCRLWLVAMSSGAPEIKGFMELPAWTVTAMVWVSDARLHSPLVLTTADAELVAVAPDLKAAAGEQLETDQADGKK